MTPPPPFWVQAVEIARKDLVVEGRAGEVLWVTIPFGAVALLLIPLAVGADLPLLARMGTSLYWVVVLLFGMLVAFRQSAVDGPAQRELLALLGVDPAARFTGRAVTGGLLLVAFQAVLTPVMVVLYNPGPLPGWPLLILVGLAVAAGLAMLGALAGEVTAGLRIRSTLAPLLVAPLAVPLLVGATQAGEALRRGSGILTWMALLLLTDLALAVTGVLTARPLEEATR